MDFCGKTLICQTGIMKRWHLTKIQFAFLGKKKTMKQRYSFPLLRFNNYLVTPQKNKKRGSKSYLNDIKSNCI